MLEFESYTQKATDEGTRYIHYTELLELWEDALILLYRQDEYSHSPKLAAEIMALEHAIATLKIQIDTMCGYKRVDYYKIRYAVDNSTKELKGGRGTPLKEDYEDKRYKDDEDGLIGV